MASYLYAIVRADLPEPGAAMRGIDQAPVRAVYAAGLTGLVSTVDADQFAAERLGEPDDLAWLERVARAHDEVVRAAAARTAVVPLRLGVVCTDDAGVAERIRGVADVVTSLLDRVTDQEEWGVKIFAAGPQREPAAAGAGAGTAMTGTAYLQQRKLALQRNSQSSAEASARADRALEELGALATAARRHPLQDRRLSGDREPMLANAAFLVPQTERHDFRAAVDRLAADFPDGRVVLTGPWPPYSFTAIADDS